MNTGRIRRDDELTSERKNMRSSDAHIDVMRPVCIVTVQQHEGCGDRIEIMFKLLRIMRSIISSDFWNPVLCFLWG